MVKTTNQKKCSMLKFFGSATVPPATDRAQAPCDPSGEIQQNGLQLGSHRVASSTAKKGHMKMDKV
jgi:hypothetical protein